MFNGYILSEAKLTGQEIPRPKRPRDILTPVDAKLTRNWCTSIHFLTYIWPTLAHTTTTTTLAHTWLIDTHPQTFDAHLTHCHVNISIPDSDFIFFKGSIKWEYFFQCVNCFIFIFPHLAIQRRLIDGLYCFLTLIALSSHVIFIAHSCYHRNRMGQNRDIPGKKGLGKGNLQLFSKLTMKISKIYKQVFWHFLTFSDIFWH